MNEESQEDGNAQCGIGVVGSIGNEAFRELVQGDGNRCLETDGEEGVLWNVVMVMIRGLRGSCLV